MIYEFEIIEQVMDEPSGLPMATLRGIVAGLPTQDFFRLLTAMVQTGKVALVGEDGEPLEGWRVSDLLRREELSETTRVTATPLGVRTAFPDDVM